MKIKTIAIQWIILLIFFLALTLGRDKLYNASNNIAGETQSINEEKNEHFVACPLSQGMLIGKQPLFIYKNSQNKTQAQLQAVKVAAGLVGSSNQPVCQYFNNQSDITFTILLPWEFPETCKAINTDRAWFDCE